MVLYLEKPIFSVHVIIFLAEISIESSGLWLEHPNCEAFKYH